MYQLEKQHLIFSWIKKIIYIFFQKSSFSPSENEFISWEHPPLRSAWFSDWEKVGRDLSCGGCSGSMTGPRTIILHLWLSPYVKQYLLIRTGHWSKTLSLDWNHFTSALQKLFVNMSWLYPLFQVFLFI